MLLNITLSAVLFSTAFLFPESLGWLIFFFPIPIWYFFKQAPDYRASFKAGFFWGLCVFGVHFTWLFDVLIMHSQASWWLCGILYSVIVIYFTLTSSCWFISTTLLQRILRSTTCALAMSAVCYWILMEHVILFPISPGYGYPFLNPFIPLASYPLFLKTIALVLGLMGYYPEKHHSQITYVAPVINKIKNHDAPWRSDPDGVGWQIYKSLYTIELENKNSQISHPELFVAPESTFCFSLNYYPDIIRLWTSAIGHNKHLFMGSIYAHEHRIYQVVFWLHRGLIIKIYVKKLLTPFVEIIPERWQHCASLKGAFLHSSREFSDTHKGGELISDVFDIGPNQRFIPQICLEFFIRGSARGFDHLKAPNKQNTILFFTNDSWFNKHFRNILYNLTVLKAQLIGLPVIYIGHHGCYQINPLLFGACGLLNLIR